jgi:hypothetical protein
VISQWAIRVHFRVWGGRDTASATTAGFGRSKARAPWLGTATATAVIILLLARTASIVAMRVRGAMLRPLLALRTLGEIHRVTTGALRGARPGDKLDCSCEAL